MGMQHRHTRFSSNTLHNKEYMGVPFGADVVIVVETIVGIDRCS